MTPSDAAHVLGVSADTVRALGDGGRLPTLRTVGGRRLFRRGDVELLATERERTRSAAAARTDGEGSRTTRKKSKPADKPDDLPRSKK